MSSIGTFFSLFANPDIKPSCEEYNSAAKYGAADGMVPGCQWHQGISSNRVDMCLTNHHVTKSW